MKFLNKFKIDYVLLIYIFLFFIISILSIYSSNRELILKQSMWYIIGFIFIVSIIFIGNKFFYKNTLYLYIIGIIFLVLVLLVGSTINGSKSWFKIPGIGNIQPSEYMKIILILIISKILYGFRKKDRTFFNEFILISKVLLVTLIPSILTFLEPDTGVVIIYIVIMFIMLFISGIRYRWFIILFLSVISIISFILITYFTNTDLFISIFGSSFFLRINRLLDWGLGYQYISGITSIGSGGFIGYGFNNTPIYFPEAHTDFIFAVFSNNFGFIGSIILITLFILFDLRLIKIAIKSNYRGKLIIGGFLGMIIYQQIQNIGMTIGLLPITGITLPFISYGGSSLLSYMIIMGIIFNIEKRA